ncbi:O-antigen/teichoic acid export membrane protein [Sphingomonas sp. SORGH_AS870]|uniref:oligosaccharide flippase family protein n=1 Tax=Sphingomonas sp. SORGH_AS_0870 TaxID=3041801 RepID=UPI0028634629|nr:oligosaccharide flippase family protein [Sphingomonas sp. SORGH_AS_0870]MDR6144284.1 O-antigen/teichoic acid export membrane protein [Sphingomonas sp. SORGH_AS_0870]
MSVRRSLFWSYGSQLITLAITFSTSVIVARLISPREMGIYALALAISGVLSVFLAFGTQAFLVREKTIDLQTLRSAFTVNLALSGLLALCLLCAGLFSMFVRHDNEISAVLLIMVAGPLFSALEFVPAALCMREMRYSTISAVNILRAVITAVVTLTCLWRGAGAPGLAVGPVFANLVCALFYMMARRHDLIFRPGLYRFREILVFGFQMLTISGVAQLAARSSDIILGNMLGLFALGLYSRASGLATLVFINVYGLATGVIFVQLSRDLREKGEFHTTFIRALRMITGAMWPILLGIATLAGPLVLILYGAKWLPAATPLALLMIAQFIVLGFGMNWELFVLRKETSQQMRIEMSRAIIGTAIFSVGCLFGLAAAAVGRIGEAIVGYVLYRPHIDRLAGTEPGEIDRVYSESLQLTAVAIAPSILLMGWWKWSPHVPLILVIFSIILGVIGWLLLLRYKRHPIASEILITVARLCGRSASETGQSS